MDFVWHNRLSELHDGKTVWFSKTERRFEDFNIIRQLDHPIVLITANSDDVVRDAKDLPDTVAHWFCLYGFFDHPRVTFIPGWIENVTVSSRGEFHGIAQPRARDRIRLLESLIPNDPGPTKFMCANFSIETKPKHREAVADICKSTPHIEWHDPMPMEQWLRLIQDYEAVVCPDGNGPDTIRAWEAIYLNRIPIIFNREMYVRFYHEYPVLYIDNADLDALRDETYIRRRLKEIRARPFDRKVLTYTYWKERIEAECLRIKSPKY